MIKKVFIIAIAFNLISLLQSCCTEEYDYMWNDFSLTVIDNSGNYPALTDGNEINKKALGFRVTLQDSVIYLAQSIKLMNTCAATSCGEEYTRTHKLLSARIKTLLAYSEEYPEDSDITELFMARESEDSESTYISVDRIISTINANSKGYNISDKFDLYLIDTTAYSGEQLFEIQLTLSDGLTFSQKTDTLTFY